MSYIGQILFSFAFALIGTFIFMQLLERIKFKDAVFVPLIGIMYGNVIGALSTFLAYEANIFQNVRCVFPREFHVSCIWAL